MILKNQFTSKIVSTAVVFQQFKHQLPSNKSNISILNLIA